MFGFSQIKLISYGVAALAVALLFWRVNSWRVQAGGKKAAVAALTAEKEARAADLLAARVELERSEASRIQLTLDKDATKVAFDAQLASIKPKTLIVTKVVPGETCASNSLSADFLLRFNAAGAVPAALQ